ncbi:MAG: methyltransferase domain-containing protein [Actinobacteria bacterium]|nr:methyltransferase domain-containing protein [Actinomycetota bacterium]
MNSGSETGSHPEPGSRSGGSDDSNWLSALATQHEIKRQRRTWDSRVNSWDRHSSPGLQTVADALIDSVVVQPGTRVLDLGCGTGRLSLPLAQRGAEVLAVDVSPAMVREVEEQARKLGLTSLRALDVPMERLDIPEGSLDLVVSNYALHHLLDPDKAKLLRETFKWLRPGGTIAVADMMLGRGGSSRDRQIIASKVKAMARRGIPGYWRILKNVVRFLVRVHECPLPPDAWEKLFKDAGFEQIESTSVVAEAGLIVGEKPS